MRTSQITTTLLSTLSACVLAFAPVHAGVQQPALDSANSPSLALRARGAADGNWMQDANGYGSVFAALTHQGQAEAGLLMFASLKPGETQYAGTIQGKLVAAVPTDPYKQPALLSVMGKWNRVDGKGGQFQAMLYLNGGGLMSAIPVGVITGQYELEQNALAATYSIQG